MNNSKEKIVETEGAGDDNDRAVSHEELVAMIKETVGALGPEVSKEEKVKQAKMLLRIFEDQVTPLKAMELTDADIAPVYALAYNLFRAGKFQEASGYYKVLLMLDPFRPSFSIALGTCFHKLKQYENAAILYMQGSLYDNADPVPFYYAYDCFMNLKDPHSAAIMLANAIERAGDISKYQPIKQRAQLLLDEYIKSGGVKAAAGAA